MKKRFIILLFGILFILIVINNVYAPPTQEYTPDASTVALWHVDEGSGNNILDAANSSNNGVLQGNTNWNTDTAPITGSTYSLIFDGDNDYAITNDSNMLNQTNLTIEFWIKLDSYSIAHVIDKTIFGPDQGYLVNIEGSAGTVKFTLNNVAWTLDTGQINITSNQNVTLSGLEDLFVFVQYN